MDSSIYNATVIGKILLTPDLMILRMKTDEPREEFLAGQYTSIGLLSNEERSANSVMPLEQMKNNILIKRPYSIASGGYETSEFEFYISQVKSGQLTPRLFNLTQGRRMWIDTEIQGFFHLNSVPEDAHIVMIATGTGLSPFISFLRTNIRNRHKGKLAIIHGAAYPWDLGYYSELRFIERNFDNFYYMPTLLKADSSWTGLTGYIEKHLDNNELHNIAQIELDPSKTHFFLCGNPKMVESVTSYLSTYNFRKHSKDNPGSIHVEEY